MSLLLVPNVRWHMFGSSTPAAAWRTGRLPRRPGLATRQEHARWRSVGLRSTAASPVGMEQKRDPSVLSVHRFCLFALFWTIVPLRLG